MHCVCKCNITYMSYDTACLLAQVLCADAEPLLSAVACSTALLQALMTAPESWPAAGGPLGHSPIGAPPAAGGASALASRWGRVLSAVLLRCGRELVGWLEVQITHEQSGQRPETCGKGFSGTPCCQHVRR